jgi:hypothetical protein
MGCVLLQNNIDADIEQNYKQFVSFIKWAWNFSKFCMIGKKTREKTFFLYFTLVNAIKIVRESKRRHKLCWIFSDTRILFMLFIYAKIYLLTNKCTMVLWRTWATGCAIQCSKNALRRLPQYSYVGYLPVSGKPWPFPHKKQGMTNACSFQSTNVDWVHPSLNWDNKDSCYSSQSGQSAVKLNDNARWMEWSLRNRYKN